jgi:hypothetical protein
MIPGQQRSTSAALRPGKDAITIRRKVIMLSGLAPAHTVSEAFLGALDESLKSVYSGN